MKNFIIGFLLLALVGAGVAYYKYPKCPPCPECPDTSKIEKKIVVTNRQALLSLADIALNRKSKSLAEAESLVKYDKEFYLAFYYGDLSNSYFYARHGSCCPCSDGGRGCCACVGGSAFGAPHSADLMTAIDSEAGNNLYTLASYSAQQKPAERKKLTLDKKTIGDTDVFTVPAGTEPGLYVVTFKGKINLVMDIDVQEGGAFEVVNPDSIVKH